MKTDLLQVLCCPNCRHDLDSLEETDEIFEGFLRCSGCGALYPIHKGMPFVYVDDEQWRRKAEEAKGWIELVKEKGIYDQILQTDDSFKLPYLHDANDPSFANDPWVITARLFDAALDLMGLRAGETVLDLGAGQGWAAKHFALQGCRVVAIDVLADDRIGLARAYALMGRAKTHFELVVGDNENLPFKESTFDLAFACNALHHSRQLARLLGSVHRVLKRGGRLIAVGEPCISLFEREEDALRHSEEVKFGIGETRPNVLGYLWQMRRAGFGDIRVETLATYWASHTEVYRGLKEELTTLRRGLPGALAWLGGGAGLLLRLPRAYAIASLLVFRHDLLILACRKP